MQLLLAPMEGLLDHHLRDMLTRVGGIDRCVSEFIRVTDTLLPERVFFRVMPELANGGNTPAGVPVRGQLLGSDPACLADNAARMASLGPTGVDLNFGCPAKVVNRHGGGAALLDDPALLNRIMAQVRRAVPAHLPVSAKMRLGTEDHSRAEDCALALAEGGAGEIVVHARSKRDGYRPPAYWERIAQLREVVDVPLVANGEIWTVDDALRCREASGCTNLMLGRGIVADPGLALAVRAALGEPALAPLAGPNTALDWPRLLALLQLFWAGVERHITPRHRPGRLKQWLNFLRRRFPEAEVAYQQLRTVNEPAAMRQALYSLS
ncbi:MAG TPA: tRNA-dihydrouridine synthase [Ideonella sp.]|uniref:tRNA dihydrouridine synthase n=1 Tax=Ideonella sp. TaxID=1929293 RepID=UPI002E312437|nr:tRNA-dihydrouridine synthase [Ideonella sp.]HEX5685571.1 tRNA-dihydrouridine synthase [Ideonella sp.]